MSAIGRVIECYATRNEICNIDPYSILAVSICGIVLLVGFTVIMYGYIKGKFAKNTKEVKEK